MSLSVKQSSAKLQWDSELIQKYNVPGPRYTSYPTAVQFSDAMADPSRIHTEAAPTGDLSLYVHIPFCRDVCFYCGCNKVVTRRPGVAEIYLDHLTKEIQMVGSHYAAERTVTQLHWGGGTPTYLSPEQVERLMSDLRTNFTLSDSPEREYSIELDPRTLAPSMLARLKQVGFNRLSLGIQDFDPDVQKAVNREQSVEMVTDLMQAARQLAFNSISFDLIYGLPRQSVQSMTVTLDRVLALSPDRISCYSYAHLPELFKPQRSIDRLEVPSGEQRLQLFEYILQRLTDAGYEYIGMDHFVKPEDDLAIARHNGRLQRNFQGYSTLKAADLVGLGVSAISSSAEFYVQNVRELDAYYQRLIDGDWPLHRGIELSEEDRLRRDVIMQLICNMRLDPRTIEQRYGIDFQSHFANELENLQPLIDDQLVNFDGREIVVTDLGRLLVRNVCMVFDQYLGGGKHHSKTI